MALGREETDKDGVQQVMRLRKSLYGIPQAPTNWLGTIDNFVTTIGFTPLKSDPCIYIYTHKGGIHNSPIVPPPARNWSRSCQGFANSPTVTYREDNCHTVDNSGWAGNR